MCPKNIGGWGCEFRRETSSEPGNHLFCVRVCARDDVVHVENRFFYNIIWPSSLAGDPHHYPTRISPQPPTPWDAWGPTRPIGSPSPVESLRLRPPGTEGNIFDPTVRTQFWRFLKMFVDVHFFTCFSFFIFVINLLIYVRFNTVVFWGQTHMLKNMLERCDSLISRHLLRVMTF